MATEQVPARESRASEDLGLGSSRGDAVNRGGEDKGLKRGALGLLSSVVIGVASTAPAYSLAATLGFVVVAVGLQSPIIMVLAFLPMLFIAVAYAELNKSVPDCGTTFTWAAKAFGPRTGWMGGWGIIIADVIVMANLAQIAGQYGFQLFNAHGLAQDKFWVTVVGVAWIVVMTYICYRGIEVSARMQYVLLGIELVVLVLLSVVALVRVYTGHAASVSIHPALSWLNPFHIPSFSAFSSAILLAVFIYWGWDTAVACNEETRDRTRTPGRAAVLSTVLLLATYIVVTIAAQAYAGVGDKGIGLTNPDNSGDVLSVLGNAVFGSHGIGSVLTHLLILMVLSSAAASTQTTILPTARTTLSMAAYRAIPDKFARMHPRYLTPTWSTVAMGLVSIVFYVSLTLVSSNLLGDTIASIGLLIAFYYGLTGFASVWFYRRELRNSGRDLLLKGVLPLIGGAMLFAAFIKSTIDYSKEDYGNTSWALPFTPHWHLGGVFLTGIGGLVLGVLLMLIYRFVAPAYFLGRTLTRETPVLASEDATVIGGVRLPDTEQAKIVVPADVAAEIGNPRSR
jgi:amino acid transporter